MYTRNSLYIIWSGARFDYAMRFDSFIHALLYFPLQSLYTNVLKWFTAAAHCMFGLNSVLKPRIRPTENGERKKKHSDEECCTISQRRERRKKNWVSCKDELDSPKL